MKRNLLFSIMLFANIGYIIAQDITISFKAEGESTTIDEVVATNLTTKESITVPGDQSLILQNSATNIEEQFSSGGMLVAPNPFVNNTKLYYSSDKEQLVTVQISDLSGKTITSVKNKLLPGTNSFNVSAGSPGLYLLTVITDDNISSVKLIQHNAGLANVKYDGITSDHEKLPLNKLKDAKAGYVLNYSEGDIISYLIKSGNNSTVINESPSESKTIVGQIVTCKDYDNNYYKIVSISNKVWMAENLKSTHYSDGTAITWYVMDDATWGYLNDYSDDAYSYYNNDSKYRDIYGAIYTHVAAVKICPKDWHLPTNEEWNALSAALGGHEVSGSKLAGSANLWNDGKLEQDKYFAYTAFDARPGGMRWEDDGDGSSSYMGENAYWWSATEKDYYDGYFYALYYDLVSLGTNYSFKSAGFYVRCVKD